MRPSRAILLALIVCGVVLAVAQAPPAAAANDPFNTSLLTGRSYQNLFLGFSWTIPDTATDVEQAAWAGHFRRSEEAARQARARNHAAGILLQSAVVGSFVMPTALITPDPQSGGYPGGYPVGNRNGYPEYGVMGPNGTPWGTYAPGNGEVRWNNNDFSNSMPGGRVPARPFQSALSAFRLTARALKSDEQSPCSVLVAQMTQVSQRGAQLMLPAQPETVAGQEFCRADWALVGTQGKRAYPGWASVVAVARTYVTLRRGYALTFNFGAPLRRDLDGLAASLRTLRFQP